MLRTVIDVIAAFDRRIELIERVMGTLPSHV